MQISHFKLYVFLSTFLPLALEAKASPPPLPETDQELPYPPRPVFNVTSGCLSGYEQQEADFLNALDVWCKACQAIDQQREALKAQKTQESVKDA